VDFFPSFSVKITCDRLGVEYSAQGDHAISDEILDELLHMILSHHGHKAWNSPVIPQTLEAYIVHIVEFMDGMVDKYHAGRIPQSLHD